MSHAIMPKDFMWWLWFVTAALLAVTITGHEAALLTAIALSLAQTIHLWRRHRTPRAIAVQIRLAYTALLIVCLAPPMRWLVWLPTAGTSALLIFGYCLIARCLSLMPWNRHEPLSLDLLCRTFFTAPRGRSAVTCGGEDGICELEARVAEHASPSYQPQLNPQLITTNDPL